MGVNFLFEKSLFVDFLAKSECFRQRDEADANTDMMMVGHFTPSCDPNGEFSAVQTHGSTGYSWCAERNGKEIEGTRVRFEEAKCDRGWSELSIFIKILRTLFITAEKTDKKY